MISTRGRTAGRLVGAGVATLLLTAAALAGGGGIAAAAGNPYERGPAPTEATFTSTTGPFATTNYGLGLGLPGFGGGTVYYPTDTSQGTFGAVVVSPGFTEPGLANNWFGPRLASQGFVVLIMDTNTLIDFPEPRGDQMLAALDYLTSQSKVKDRIDPHRLAVMGHSMGGGGSLDASIKRPALQAAIPMEPYETGKTFYADKVPTLIIGAKDDTTAPVAQHARPFYNQLSGSLDKAYLELASGGHLATNSPSTTVAKYTISWLKRFVDDDTRYDPFICAAPAAGANISTYLTTCPLG